MKRERSLILTVGKKFPFIYNVKLAEQWDLEKQPLFCLFVAQENRTDRIFTF